MDFSQPPKTTADEGRDTLVDAVTVHLRYFAAAREAAGVDAEIVTVAAGTTIGALRAVLGERHPALVPVLRQSRLSQHQRFAKDDDVVDGGAEIAVIPPVAGG